MAKAFTILTILNILQEPLRSLPLFMGQMIEFMIAMRRIQDFIGVDEINSSIIDRVDRETAD